MSERFSKPLDADGLAAEIVSLLSVCEPREKIYCYLDAVGSFGFSYIYPGSDFDPFDLVGVYTNRSNAKDIAQDIRATERIPIRFVP